MQVDKDFYVDQRWLASYFEKDWFDKVCAQSGSKPPFHFPHFPEHFLYSPYHEEFAAFLFQELNKAQVHPQAVFEVGSSLGRTFYEICRAIKSVGKAVLLEPSQNLSECFEKIFGSGGIQNYPFLYGNRELTEVAFDSSEIKEACAHVKRTLLSCPFKEAPRDLGSFELVICSNVVDQCHEPEALIQFLQKRTAKGGLLAISSTYQWNDKYIDPAKQTIGNIKDLFDGHWKVLNETNLEFKCRRSERHWLNFLSHVLVVQKV